MPQAAPAPPTKAGTARRKPPPKTACPPGNRPPGAARPPDGRRSPVTERRPATYGYRCRSGGARSAESRAPGRQLPAERMTQPGKTAFGRLSPAPYWSCRLCWRPFSRRDRLPGSSHRGRPADDAPGRPARASGRRREGRPGRGCPARTGSPAGRTTRRGAAPPAGKLEVCPGGGRPPRVPRPARIGSRTMSPGPAAARVSGFRYPSGIAKPRGAAGIARSRAGVASPARAMAAVMGHVIDGDRYY
jgi:hypothetical protein